MKYVGRIPEEVDRALQATGRQASGEYAAELHRQRVQKWARGELAAEEAREAVKDWAAPRYQTARDFLKAPDLTAEYRVEELWPTGGTVVLAAQAKAGKTTMTLNLIWSLVTGNDFLKRFPVHEVTGRVCLVDLELSDHILRRWLSDLRLDSERLLLMPLRGRAAWLAEAVTNPVIRARFAQVLREQEVEVLIIDPLAPLLAGAGIDENSNTEVGGLLRGGLAALQTESGVSELLLVHHAGHDTNRARGASALMDWPDAIWTYEVKAGSSGNSADEAADTPRYFRAVGRDVDLPRTFVAFDHETRRLAIDSDPAARDAQHKAAQAAAKDEQVLGVLREDLGGLARTDSEWGGKVGGRAADYRSARDRLVAAGLVRREGVGRGHQFVLVEAKMDSP